MRKYIMLIAIIFVSSFILFACSSNDSTEDEDSDEEVEEENEDEAENDDDSSSDLTSIEREDIEFGDKVDMGEESAIEDTLSFIDDIKYPDIKLKNDEESKFFVKTKINKEDDPDYFLNLQYIGDDENDTSTFLQVYVFSNEEEYEDRVSEANETKTLADGTEVKYRVHDNGSRWIYLEDGDFYYVFFTPQEEEKMAEETFMNAVEGLSERNHIYDLVKESFEQSAEDYFAMPTYFPVNIDFNQLTIHHEAIGFDYLSRYYVNEDEGVFTSINLLMSDELSPYTIEDAEEIELPSGQKAYLSTHHGEDYKNEVFF